MDSHFLQGMQKMCKTIETAWETESGTEFGQAQAMSKKIEIVPFSFAIINTLSGPIVFFFLFSFLFLIVVEWFWIVIEGLSKAKPFQTQKLDLGQNSCFPF